MGMDTGGDGTGSDREDESGKSTDDVKNQYFAVGIAIGMSIGTALSVALDNWGLLGAGLAIGVALGIGLGHQKSGR